MLVAWDDEGLHVSYLDGNAYLESANLLLYL